MASSVMSVGPSSVAQPARIAQRYRLSMAGRSSAGAAWVVAVQDLSAVMMVAFATAKSARVPQIGWRAKSRKPRKRLP